METEGGNREQYEHILAQAARLDHAAQINLLRDLAAQMHRSPATGPTAEQGLQKMRLKTMVRATVKVMPLPN